MPASPLVSAILDDPVTKRSLRYQFGPGWMVIWPFLKLLIPLVVAWLFKASEGKPGLPSGGFTSVVGQLLPEAFLQAVVDEKADANL